MRWVSVEPPNQEGLLCRGQRYAEGSRCGVQVTSLKVQDEEARKKLEVFLCASYAAQQEAQRMGGGFWFGPVPRVFSGEPQGAMLFAFMGAEVQPSRRMLPEENLFCRLPNIAAFLGEYFTRLRQMGCDEVPRDWLMKLCKKPGKNEFDVSGEVYFAGDPLECVNLMDETCIEFWTVQDAAEWVREMTRERYRRRLGEQGVRDKYQNKICKRLQSVVDEIDLMAGRRPICQCYQKLDARAGEEIKKMFWMSFRRTVIWGFGTVILLAGAGGLFAAGGTWVLGGVGFCGGLGIALALWLAIASRPEG